MADGVLKGVYPQVFGRSRQLLQNKFFYLRSRSIRKGCDGEEVEVAEKKSENSSLGFSLPTTLAK